MSAYVLWGMFPLYFPLLSPSSPAEILAHRIVWSMLVVAGLVVLRGRVKSLRRTGWRRTRLLALAAVALALNWLTYIYGVTTGQVVETSLGYFINPLVTVLLAVVLLGERLRPLQWVALGITTVAVVVLTLDYGRLPWIALTLAGSFGSYGLLKKKAGSGAVEGLAVETAVLTLPALGFLAWLAASGDSTFGRLGTAHAALLALSGVVTILPLLLFAVAATRLPLATMGLLQYITPVLQLMVGVLVYRESMPPARLLGFTLVWLALTLLALESAHRSTRRFGCAGGSEVEAMPAAA